MPRQRQGLGLARKRTMIYDVNSALFRSFLSQKGGAADKRKNEDQKPKEQRPKASENKPVMNE
ncbi:wound-induced basic protein-like [Selaginella moellendorffii]|uniref:wound-induced basic protein-like n=1 Tax=Selaginella moellendorffii TaxID=88036 RepID=UPI000D1C8C93|nr:wound-induced basic protein-like [Selaginella moellendorffii]|eukprot:XP_024545439.1 wound-induced basic protein-like [Selaginella moellendorffii]